MEYTMSMYRSKDDMISDMRAEITKLRAELEQERELADRAVDALRLHYVDEISVRNVKAVGVIVLHDARRNK